MAHLVGAHNELHSEHGALKGEHPGRSTNPVIKVSDLAWLEFEKPDLVRAEAFARAFGFQTAQHSPDELHLRGTDPGAPAVILRRGPRTRFCGIAFKAVDEIDVLRLADKTGATAVPLPEALGGMTVQLTDPSGIPVRVVAGLHQLPELPEQRPQVVNVSHDLMRINATQRPARAPARVQRLGHLVVQSNRYL